MVKLDEDIEENEPEWMREQYEVGMAQAKALAEKAALGGLRFEAYLPPELATWVLDHVAAGRFYDPSELAFVLLGEMRDIERFAPDVRAVALGRSLEAASEGPTISSEEFEREMKEKPAKPIPPAAEWVRQRQAE